MWNLRLLLRVNVCGILIITIYIEQLDIFELCCLARERRGKIH